jgi:hypothetical protein
MRLYTAVLSVHPRPTAARCFSCSAATATVAAPSCQAARLLRGRFDTEDDPSGYAAYTAARAINPLASKVRNGNTPEAAESTSNAAFLGESQNTAMLLAMT